MDLPNVPLNPILENLEVGFPALVSLDLDAGVIVIDAGDESLVDITYQVFINCHVAVDPIV